MAVPDYFGRNAVAIAQAISGLDDKRLALTLDEVCVGITFGPDAVGAEGGALSDLLIRLVARLYPRLMVRADRNNRLVHSAQELASRINPRIEFAGTPTIEIVVGSSRLRPRSRSRIFVGSAGWTATISSSDFRCASL